VSSGRGEIFLWLGVWYNQVMWNYIFSLMILSTGVLWCVETLESVDEDVFARENNDGASPPQAKRLRLSSLVTPIPKCVRADGRVEGESVIKLAPSRNAVPHPQSPLGQWITCLSCPKTCVRSFVCDAQISFFWCYGGTQSNDALKENELLLFGRLENNQLCCYFFSAHESVRFEYEKEVYALEEKEMYSKATMALQKLLKVVNDVIQYRGKGKFCDSLIYQSTKTIRSDEMLSLSVQYVNALGQRRVFYVPEWNVNKGWCLYRPGNMGKYIYMQLRESHAADLSDCTVRIAHGARAEGAAVVLFEEGAVRKCAQSCFRMRRGDDVL